MIEALLAILEHWQDRVQVLSLVHRINQSTDMMQDFLTKNAKEIIRTGNAIARYLDNGTVTYSKNLFIPVSKICRNDCKYCNFKMKDEGDALGKHHLLYPIEHFREDLARAQEVGCKEILFCGGEGAGDDERVIARMKEEGITSGDLVDWLLARGNHALSRGLLPHTNIGLLGESEMRRLKDVNASMGLMLETTNESFLEPGGVHEHSPGKDPARRLAMIETAGRLRIPFTSGILLGIGESLLDILDSLLALRRVNKQHGHIQEIIVQPLKAPPATIRFPFTNSCRSNLHLAVGLARIIMQDDVAIQVPPNLININDVTACIAAGASDLGGISPISVDHVNPTSPWPRLNTLERELKIKGYRLRERAAVHEPFYDWLSGKPTQVLKQVVALIS
ncbi:7,8-didemethyl-8-hydroxy-5-deazariboflavin synthase subunit CofG [Candidatus Bathyarchaeota archaeon]|nr:7,8-didemethyl-8-hydroxy-5-deazariboflavin synthase subunit CofG [Candidatus Bathyarchaeota archaeon]